MVSSGVATARLARARIGLSVPALFAVGVWLLFAGCSKSECLRDDCQTSEATDDRAGTSGVAPAHQKCSANSGCKASAGELCVAGKCELTCRSHYDCQGYGECTSGTDSAGALVHFCAAGKQQKAGEFYAHCPSGTDADCDAVHGFFCVGAGSDDLDAYCTADCTDDSACPDGFACTALTRTPCVDTCGLQGDPKDRQCIKSDQIGAGKAYQCGKRGVTRNACRPKKFCSPCESDEDCLGVANQVCAKDMSGSKTCTQLCDIAHPSCPWGNAATCGVWDQDLGVATCAHRFGKCTGSGKGCEPCLKDSDCGSNGACTASSFTGERWCVDFSVSCSCGAAADASGLCTGGGCPQSPGGLELLCVDSTPSVANSGVCAGANTTSALLSSPQTGCWPVN